MAGRAHVALLKESTLIQFVSNVTYGSFHSVCWLWSQCWTVKKGYSLHTLTLTPTYILLHISVANVLDLLRSLDLRYIIWFLNSFCLCLLDTCKQQIHLNESGHTGLHMRLVSMVMPQYSLCNVQSYVFVFFKLHSNTLYIYGYKILWF